MNSDNRFDSVGFAALGAVIAHVLAFAFVLYGA